MGAGASGPARSPAPGWQAVQERLAVSRSDVSVPAFPCERPWDTTFLFSAWSQLLSQQRLLTSTLRELFPLWALEAAALCRELPFPSVGVLIAFVLTASVSWLGCPSLALH